MNHNSLSARQSLCKFTYNTKQRPLKAANRRIKRTVLQPAIRLTGNKKYQHMPGMPPSQHHLRPGRAVAADGGPGRLTRSRDYFAGGGGVAEQALNSDLVHTRRQASHPQAGRGRTGVRECCIWVPIGGRLPAWTFTLTALARPTQ